MGCVSSSRLLVVDLTAPRCESRVWALPSRCGRGSPSPSTERCPDGNSIDRVIHLLAFLSYAGAFALWVLVLLLGPSARGVTSARVLTAIAAILHFGALLHFRLTTGELPLVGHGAAFSSLAFVGGVVLTAMLPLREGVRVAIGLLPFILLLQGAALILGIVVPPVALDYRGIGFILHVAFAFLGYQGFAVAFAAGALYLIQHHELKVKRLGRFFSFLPPLAVLDRVGRIASWLGLAFLTLSLLLGWYWTVENRGSFELSNPKVLWALLSWAILAGILALRHGKGSTEYRSAVVTIVGFALVIGLYLALRLALPVNGLFL